MAPRAYSRREFLKVAPFVRLRPYFTIRLVAGVKRITLSWLTTFTDEEKGFFNIFARLSTKRRKPREEFKKVFVPLAGYLSMDISRSVWQHVDIP